VWILLVLVADIEWLQVGTDEVKVAGGERGAVAHHEPAGLDAGMPTDGAYAHAILLDAQRRSADALKEYGRALDELDGLDRLMAPSRVCMDRWRARILGQRELAERSLEEEAYAEVVPTSAPAHANLADSMRARYLAVRSFTGRIPRALWDGARAEYERALEIDPRNVQARIGLASTWADGGDVPRGRIEILSLGRRVKEELFAVPLAAFSLAAGDPDDAIDRLAHADLRPEERRALLVGSLFEGLRPDPRFRAIFPSPELAPLVGDCR
jgi:tetratricopeptide (TPR) repeat protein